jgi:hypothetical protein
MQKTLPILLTAVAIVVIAGLVHGMWTDRWTRGRDLQIAVDRLQAPPPPEGNGVPLTIQDWKAVDEQELTANVLQAAGIDGYRVRRYENKVTDKQVVMFLVCGRPGRISQHTPDVCFEGGGYKMAGNPESITVPWSENRSATFWTARFSQQGVPAPKHVRVFWTWSGTDGNWKAVDFPRVQFSRFPALYKLYVHRELTSPDEPFTSDACLEFIGVLLPALQKSLFSSADL